MKTYIVTLEEKHLQKVSIEANNEAEAKKKVSEGYGYYEGGTDLSPNNWPTVYKIEEGE